MPNFKTHQYVNYVLLILISIFLYYTYQLYYLYLFFIIGYIIGTNYITPDLDINSKPSNHKIWWLYKKFSKHRGKTHSLFYGFLFPILYIMIILIIFVYVIGLIVDDNYLMFRFIENSIKLITTYYIYAIIFIFGIGIADGIHIILDKLMSKR